MKLSGGAGLAAVLEGLSSTGLAGFSTAGLGSFSGPFLAGLSDRGSDWGSVDRSKQGRR